MSQHTGGVMSKKHPVIAVTGSSGAGTTTVKQAFENIFFRMNLNAVIVEGDSFHRYDRVAMKKEIAKHDAAEDHFSHFSPKANYFDKIAELFCQDGKTGIGKRRLYLHNNEDAQIYALKAGEFSPWKDIEQNTDLLFYEGLHGGISEATPYVDLLIGVVPIVNLEWIQKIHRDTKDRGYSADKVTKRILRRMYDYVHYITPQFTYTDINFQRVPTVDTSNPFIARDIPTLDESFVVIRFREPRKFNVDFPYLLSMIDRSFMSRRNSIVVPGGKMGFAMEIIVTPILNKMLGRKE